MTPLQVPITLCQPCLGRAIPRSQRSAITDSQLLKREMIDIQSAQLNWMLPRQRRHPRQTPQHLMTPWMPWKVGTMMVSSLVSSKLLHLVNPEVAIASTARKKVTIGVNARRPSPQSSKNCPISKTGSERKGRKRSLNPKGGMGAKGGQALTPLVGANLVPPQVSGVPAQ